jgi:nucleotide-binding universal stress UspA family protein
MGRIVVGVDGGEGSLAALAWALGEARLRSAVVEAVCAYDRPASLVGMGEAMGATVGLPIGESDMAAYATGALEAAMAGLETDGTEVAVRAVEGDAARVLEQASDGAELLVVGVGHADLGSRLVGSVWAHCAHHAACPVVLVRAGPGN